MGIFCHEANNTISATITVGTNPYGIALSPNGFCYVANYTSGTVSVIRLSSNTVIATITVGTNPYGVGISSDGSLCYVANSGSGTISVISTITNTVIYTITVGTTPCAFGNFISSLSVITNGDFMNKFRNATMDIWQRGAGSMTVTTSGAYVPDGWIVVPTGASCTAQQTTSNTRSGTLSTYSLLMTGATSVTDILVKQRIESFIAVQLEGQQVTVQAQVYNNTGASITPTLTVKHANAADNWAASTTDVSAVSLQACANGAWTKVAYTFAASTSSGNGLEITFDFGNNFSTTGKSVQITELDIRPTPGASTGVNSFPPVPEVRPIQVELAFCQRYLCKTFLQGTAPAQAAGLSTGEIFILSVNASANTNYFLWLFPVTMRTSPTVTTYNPVSSNANWRDTTANADLTVGSLGSYDNKTGIFVQAAVTVGNNVRIHALATAEL